jgi:PncC family amidohydrolase
MREISRLITILKEIKLTVAVAESVSGGYVSYLFTKVPGSSKVFKGGIVVYSLESKRKFFGITKPYLEKTQGVSKRCAIVLAKKTRRLFNSDIGCSIVGFAGPRAQKGVRVGTVFVAVSLNNRTVTKRNLIKGSRDTIRRKASQILLDVIYKQLLAL